MEEQCARWFSSREPAHCTKATFFASLPSEGRVILPPVGPLGAASRSIIMFVTTFGTLPKPRMSIFVASEGFQPVAITTAPTFTVTVSGFMSRWIASYLQASAHLPQEGPLQVFSSMTYLRGNAWLCGR